MSSTTDHQDYADVDGQTPGMLRHNLRRARERIATLIGMLDDERAKHAEHDSELAMARYHHYEIASAAFQIGIVLASATVITGMVALSFLAGALGIVGIGFMAIGLFAPHAVHLF